MQSEAEAHAKVLAFLRLRLRGGPQDNEETIQQYTKEYLEKWKAMEYHLSFFDHLEADTFAVGWSLTRDALLHFVSIHKIADFPTDRAQQIQLVDTLLLDWIHTPENQATPAHPLVGHFHSMWQQIDAKYGTEYMSKRLELITVIKKFNVLGYHAELTVIDQHLATYQGKEQQLVMAVLSSYLVGIIQTRKWVTDFYKKHNPEKLDAIPSIIEQHKSPALLEHLRLRLMQQYEPEKYLQFASWSNKHPADHRLREALIEYVAHVSMEKLVNVDEWLASYPDKLHLISLLCNDPTFTRRLQSGEAAWFPPWRNPDYQGDRPMWVKSIDKELPIPTTAVLPPAWETVLPEVTQAELEEEYRKEMTDAAAPSTPSPPKESPTPTAAAVQPPRAVSHTSGIPEEPVPSSTRHLPYEERVEAIEKRWANRLQALRRLLTLPSVTESVPQDDVQVGGVARPAASTSTGEVVCDGETEIWLRVVEDRTKSIRHTVQGVSNLRLQQGPLIIHRNEFQAEDEGGVPRDEQSTSGRVEICRQCCRKVREGKANLWSALRVKEHEPKDEPVLRTGVLQKLGGWPSSKWQERYVRATDTGIHWYLSSTSPNPQNSRVFDSSTRLVESASGNPNPKLKEAGYKAFGIHTSPPDQILWMRSSVKTADEWIEFFRRALKRFHKAAGETSRDPCPWKWKYRLRGLQEACSTQLAEATQAIESAKQAQLLLCQEENKKSKVEAEAVMSQLQATEAEKGVSNMLERLRRAEREREKLRILLKETLKRCTEKQSALHAIRQKAEEQIKQAQAMEDEAEEQEDAVRVAIQIAVRDRNVALAETSRLEELMNGKQRSKAESTVKLRESRLALKPAPRNDFTVFLRSPSQGHSSMAN